ncbi:MAG: cytochrome c oxidase subunit II [Bacteroidetes bacterium]|nr:cytochrome c oxidase subunit II [Bacteroidota bacterium]
MNAFLILLVLFFGLSVIWQIIRIFELTSILQDKVILSELPSEQTNNFNGTLLFIGTFFYLGAFVYLFFTYRDKLLPPSASEHGFSIDALFGTTIVIISIVFFLTHILLAFFVYKYYGKHGRKAYFYHDNSRLEFFWTLIPTVVLSGLILYGLIIWDRVMNPSDSNAMHIEIYAKQFQWYARYPGADSAIGIAGYQHIAGTNALGLDTNDRKGWDDVITGDLHLPVNRPVLLTFRSQDVIHSAYLPHFRMQMNCVPGMTTRFQFTPQTTTTEMRLKENNPDFDFILLCNKICGAAHYNMKMPVVVEEESLFKKWIDSQAPFMAGRSSQVKNQSAELNVLPTAPVN